jgi:hypothetical protein
MKRPDVLHIAARHRRRIVGVFAANTSYNYACASPQVALLHGALLRATTHMMKQVSQWSACLMDALPLYDDCVENAHAAHVEDVWSQAGSRMYARCCGVPDIWLAA